jgi:hypothetical protein
MPWSDSQSEIRFMHQRHNALDSRKDLGLVTILEATALSEHGVTA